MAIAIRPGNERGFFDFGWLKTFHSFSFAGYYDPRFMGFKSLRVINEDRIAAGKGFARHPHHNMEIITFVISGALKHEDSTGTGSIIEAGQVQRMSAGTGITHSEYNASKTDELHLLQIWITPDRQGLEPGYEEKDLRGVIRPNDWILLASPKGDATSLTIHQDCRLSMADLEPGKQLEYTLKPQRALWLQVVKGDIGANGATLKAGDGAGISGENLAVQALSQKAQVLLFDLSQ